MIYLIGGPARCGKSTLAARVRKEIDGQVLSGDAFTEMLRKNLKPGWVPDIYDHDMAPIGDMLGYRNKIDRLRRRDEAMWQFFFEYIRTSVEDAPSDDILLEGNIWPDYLEDFGYPHKAAFLIDTSPDQVVRLKQIRDKGEGDNNWMRHYTDDRLLDWARFNVERSLRYDQLCKRQGYTSFDIAELGMQGAEEAAAGHLLGKEI